MRGRNGGALASIATTNTNELQRYQQIVSQMSSTITRIGTRYQHAALGCLSMFDLLVNGAQVHTWMRSLICMAMVQVHYGLIVKHNG